MGSKKLKAIVAGGTLPIEEADPERMAAHRKESLEYMKKTLVYEMFHESGTCSITATAIASGDAPVKNFAGAPEEFKDPEGIHDDRVMAYQDKRFACWRCPIACGGHVTLNGKSAHKPEYETIIAFGALNLNSNMESIIEANNICNQYGLDTISTGVTVAFAVDCYESGILSKADTGRLALNWGKGSAIVELTGQIARGEGLGRVLGDGAQVAAERIGKGADKLAMHIHGEEIPMHDIRHAPGVATSYQTDATPGRHTQHGSWFHEIDWLPAGLAYPKYEDKYTYTGKGGAHKVITNYGHVVDAAGMCQFTNCCLRADDIVAFLSAASGVEFTIGKVQEIGERIANLRIAFNVREGVLPGAVTIPGRAFGKPPLTAGPTQNVTVDTATQTREYFREMGWDEETGRASLQALRRLGLDFAAEQIAD